MAARPEITGFNKNAQGQLVIVFKGQVTTNYEVTKSLTMEQSPFLPLGTPVIVTTEASGFGQAIVPVAEQTLGRAFFRIEKR